MLKETVQMPPTNNTFKNPPGDPSSVPKITRIKRVVLFLSDKENVVIIEE
jgi:hypothetical protein